MEDLVIVGSGPAGLTAGLYAARAGVKPLVLEGLEPGGALMPTRHVANYPGVPDAVSGAALIGMMRRQAEAAGARFATDVVEGLAVAGATRRLATMLDAGLEARAVILATGAGVAKTGLPGEAAYWGRGISACLTCDGAFYAKRRVVVVGAGDGARNAAAYLARCGADVVATYAPETLVSFDGDGRRLTGVATQEAYVPCDGVFLVTARVPQTAFLRGGPVTLDAQGYVRVTDGVKTAVPGVFAAGDCARPRHKQAVIAAGDGALAALAALEYLRVKG